MQAKTRHKIITYAYGQGHVRKQQLSVCCHRCFNSDTAAKLVRQQSVSLRSIRQPLK